MDTKKRNGTTSIEDKKRYATFQLFAEVKNKNRDADSAFEMCILETLHWLRTRLEKTGSIPEELILPTSDEYNKFEESMLKSIHLDCAAIIDVIYTKGEIRKWAIRITETDAGANIGTDVERLPVPGRTFETNVSFMIKDSIVFAGFKTICSQPAECDDDCEVFRPRLVRTLCNNPLLGLKQIASLDGKIKSIESDKDARKLISLLENKERQIPVLIITEIIEEKAKEDIEILGNDRKGLKKDIYLNTNSDKFQGSNQKYFKNPFGISREELDVLAHELIAVCLIRIVPKIHFSTINNYFRQIDICDGDWIISYPKIDMPEIITSYKIVHNTQRKVKSLKIKLMEYPKRKDIFFGDLEFYIQAQLKQFEEKENHLTKVNEKNVTLKEEVKALKNMISEIQESNNDHQKTYEANNKLSRDLSYLNELIEKKDEEIKKLKEFIKKRDKENNDLNNLIASYSEKCKDASKFPTHIKDIPEWVENEFAGYVRLHNRAISELKGCKRPDVTAYTLCTAIYYIFGYSRYTRQEILDIERDRFYRIDIPWEVTFSGKERIRLFQDEYSISVKDLKGRIKVKELDLHLKHGINNSDLIRIYFCWDKDRKEILIGSLPDHLS